ncbi:hypothetical protein PRUPE_4G129100 [Prunus persica]|uniref:Uncharacterized protein n=1 Tax=Prunus persica TaxID=3760 RepID=A0A251PJU3_PRUPE|nr:hypothetical protein PRUPE_4G129100 [Prunus persica]
MVPRANYVMSLFILVLLFSSETTFARVSYFSETKDNKGSELLRMNNINMAKKIRGNSGRATVPSGIIS